jgi:hypothetical protein
VVDGEDGPDGHVDVDVRGPVQGVEDQDVVSGREPIRNGEDLLRLLGDHAAEVSGVVEGVVDHVLGEHVELLDLFSVDVAVPGPSEDVHEPRLVHLPADHLRGQGHVVEEVRQCPRGFRVPTLLVHDVPLQGDDAALRHGNLVLFGDPAGPSRRGFQPDRGKGRGRKASTGAMD